MILDPVNGVTSLAFYRKVAKQPVGRTFLYLGYVALLFSVAATVALKVRLGPSIDETFEWLANSAPPVTFSGGKATSALTGPVTIRHPEVKEVALTIDTTRTEPVTPDLMEKDNVMAYLTSNALYIRQQPGRLDTYDLSKAGAVKPVTIDAAFYRNAERLLSRILYPLSLVVMFFVFFLWKGAVALAYSLVALLANSLQSARLEYASLFNIALYAQTLVIVIQAILLFMPAGIPFFALIGFVLTGIYIWLGVRANLDHPAPAV